MTHHQTIQNTPNSHPVTARRTALFGATAAVAALLLAGCGDAASTSDPTAPATSAAAASPAATGQTASAQGGITVTDPWTKATDERMTGVFAVIVNDTDRQLHLIGAQTETAQRAELHETADDGTGSTLMQEKEGGFVIEPGQSLELVPGGDHVMLMQLTGTIEPGQQVTVTLEFADGTTVPMQAVAKEYAGANEVYESEGAEDPDGGDHGDH